MRELRDAVRRIAKHEHISQNEYIEQAIVNDLTLRGALRAEHLRAAAEQLAGIAKPLQHTPAVGASAG